MSRLLFRLNSGFTLLEVLMTIGLLSIVTMGTTEYLSQQQKAQRINLTAFNRDILISQLARNLEYPRSLATSALYAGDGHFPSNAAFNSCVNGGSGADCSNAADQPLVLTDTLGNVVAGTPATPQYYNLDGKVCTTGPDSNCGIQAFTTFTADCGGPAACTGARSVSIKFTLQQAPGIQLAYNIQLKGFSTSSVSPVPLLLANIGTPGQLPLWVTDNTLGDSIATQYNQQIGLNTWNPQASLDVLAAPGSAGNLLIENNSTTAGRSPRVGFVDTSQGGGSVTTAPAWYVDNRNDVFRIFRQPDIATPGVAMLTVNANGNVRVAYNGQDGIVPGAAPKNLLEVFSDNPGTDFGNDVAVVSYSPWNFDAALTVRRARGTKASPQGLLKDDLVGGYFATGYNGSKFVLLGMLGSFAEQDLTADGQGYLVFETANHGITNESLRITASNTVGIGTKTPTEKLHVVGQVHVHGAVDCILGGPGGGGTSCSSDARLKENVVPIENALARILQIRGVEFDWNRLARQPGRHAIGVIAQEVEKVFPSLVIENKATGFKMVDYSALVAPLIQATHELHEQAGQVGLYLSRMTERLQLFRVRSQPWMTELKAAEESQNDLKRETDELKARLVRLREARNGLPPPASVKDASESSER